MGKGDNITRKHNLDLKVNQNKVKKNPKNIRNPKDETIFYILHSVQCCKVYFLCLIPHGPFFQVLKYNCKAQQEQQNANHPALSELTSALIGS